MSSELPDLAGIAADTVTALAEIWNDLGAEEDEREQLVRQLCDNVANIYSQMREKQQARIALANTQIVEFTENICSMAVELDEPVEQVSECACSLLSFSNFVDAMCNGYASHAACFCAV